MSRIVLVRHGETIWHGENRYAGSSDIELNERGMQQARALAWWARYADLSRIYVSPLRRARATAQAVEEVVQIRSKVDARLREIDFGQGEGLTPTEMRERFPEQYAAFREDPVKHFLPGGEDPMHAISRGRAALRDIATLGDPQTRVMVIAHNTLIRLLLCDLLGIAPARYRDVFPELRNVSINEIDLTENTAALLHFNLPIA